MTRTYIDWSNVEAAAEEMAKNHARFDSFAWWGDPEDSERWCIVYTHNRDSGLLDQSNAAVIEQEMGAFDEDVVSQRHSHWACGWIDGYVIRVYRPDGSITEAFRTYCKLMDRLSDYPVLDEEDYSRREYEATLENIRDAGQRFVRDYAPDGWVGEAFTWLWDNNQREVENRDDQGGYPSDEAMKEALHALGLLDADIALEEFGDDGLPDVRWAVFCVSPHGEEVLVSQYASEWEADNDADFRTRYPVRSDYVRHLVKRVVRGE